MDDVTMRMAELTFKDYFCSQILMILALEAQGKTDPDLIRAMGGLAHGCGFEGGSCGALTGAACVLGLYAGKGADGESIDWQLGEMLQDLGEWFDQTYGSEHGDTTCRAIVGDGTDKMQRCGSIVAQTHAKVIELLTANGYDLAGGK